MVRCVVSESVLQFVAIRRIRAPVQRDFTVNALGSREHVDSIDFCEPHVASVRDALRAVATWSPSELARRRRAARVAAEAWSWGRAAGVMADAVRELATA